jgi:hypothetical protein
MSKVTLEIDLEKLSEKGRGALETLMAEISRSPERQVMPETIERLADKLYRRMTKVEGRKGAMRKILEALLIKGSLSMEEMKEAVESKKKSTVAGALSSMTRNWKKYAGRDKEQFLVWDENIGEGAYRLEDKGMLEPLREARKRHGAHPS